MFFKMPEFKALEFVRFTSMFDIDILLAFSKEDLFVNFIEGYIRVNKSNTIPREVQLEKLQEKFGQFVKEAQ